MDWISNPVNFFIVLGIALVVLEVAVMQLSTFWFLYIGLGSLIAALILWFFPDLGWQMGTAIFIVATIVITLAINKPLRKWQQQPGPIAGNDAVGQTVEVLETVTAEKPGKVNWSGSDWHAELAAGAQGSLEAGQRATIVSMHGITLVVE